MANYDVVGNIAIVKFPRGEKLKDKKKFAERFLKSNKAVRTVLEKSDKFKGRLRTQSTKYLAGEKTKEALYKENGCLFRFNVDSCYFSPRLAAERLEIARRVKRRENVLVMFGGIAPFAIVIARHSRAARVVSVELGKECSRYAQENVKRNKLGNIEIIQGDVKRVLPRMKEKFDRIVMARPNLRDSFLDLGFGKIKKGGVIHYYGFYPEESKGEMLSMVKDEASKAKRKIKILKVKKAGEIGTKKYRFRVDLKVLN
jgi:tRNA (guanine37-N1)-methyltransferase